MSRLLGAGLNGAMLRYNHWAFAGLMDISLALFYKGRIIEGPTAGLPTPLDMRR